MDSAAPSTSLPCRSMGSLRRGAYFTRISGHSLGTVDAVVKTWLPQAQAKGLAATPSPGQPWMIEYYGEDFDPKTGTGTMEVWFPVKQ